MTTSMVAREGKRVAKADPLGELYARHAPGAVRFAFLLTGDQAAAEDLFHDAFIRAGAKLGALRDPEAFGGYLRRAIVNLHTSKLRRLRLERAHSHRESERVARGAPAADAGIDDREVLWQGIRRLPARQRAAIVLRYYDDQTEHATAQILGCSVAAVKSLTQRALASLRAEIPGDHDA